MTTSTLTPELLHKMNAYWRAANYLSVGQIYLYDNPLLKRPLTLADLKHMLLGHWGTPPGQNFIYVHLNRVIKKYDLDMIYVSGPGHGGPAIVGNTYLEGAPMGRRDRARRRIPRARGASDGNAQRAPMRGLAGGLPAHRPARTLQLLRGLQRRHRGQTPRTAMAGDGRRRQALHRREEKVPSTKFGSSSEVR
jgi:hypothetical protein